MTPQMHSIALDLIDLDPPDAVAAIVESPRNDLRDLCRSLENIAEYAAWLARYVDERDGWGCGDQGHAAAVKKANSTAKTVWCKAFGYSAFVPRNSVEPA